MARKRKTTGSLLAAEWAVAVFYWFGMKGITQFNQDELADCLNSAARKWKGPWSGFGARRLGSSRFDEVAVGLLQGGSLIRNSRLKTLRSTTHTRGLYGRRMYYDLPAVLQKQAAQFVDTFSNRC